MENNTGYLAELAESKLIDSRTTDRADLLLDIFTAQAIMFHNRSVDIQDFDRAFRCAEMIDRMAGCIHLFTDRSATDGRE